MTIQYIIIGSLPLTECLPTNLVIHSWGILHTCLPLHCRNCRWRNEWSICGM